MATRHQRTGRMLAWVSAALFLAIGILPTNQLLLRSIEYRVAQPALPSHVDGILTLGGGPPQRLLNTYALAIRYPGARVVFSGGSGNLFNNIPGEEGQQARHVLVVLGLNPARLTLEGQSRNTWENILFTQRLIRPTPDQTWILATSALQMTRSMEIARRLNWNLTPFLTDRISQKQVVAKYFDVPSNLQGFDDAVHELVGLSVYQWNDMASATKN